MSTKTKQNCDLDELAAEVDLDVAKSLTSRFCRIFRVENNLKGFSADEEDMEKTKKKNGQTLRQGRRVDN